MATKALTITDMLVTTISVVIDMGFVEIVTGSVGIVTGSVVTDMDFVEIVTGSVGIDMDFVEIATGFVAVDMAFVDNAGFAVADTVFAGNVDFVGTGMVFDAVLMGAIVASADVGMGFVGADTMVNFNQNTFSVNHMPILLSTGY